MSSSAALLLDEGAGQRNATRFIVAGRFGDEPELISHQRLDHFAAAGGRLLETAASYAEGRSEQVVGRWLRTNPGALGIITKVGYSMSGGDIELHREVVRRRVERSLRRLGVPTVDVLLLHRDDPARPVSELAETLTELLERGYARRVGVSNWTAGRLAELAALMGDVNHVPVVSYHRSLAVPRFHDSAVPYADDEIMALVEQYRMPLLAWAANAYGYFAASDSPRGDGRTSYAGTRINRVRRQRCRVLAERLGCRPETVALAWLLHHDRTWASIGTSSIARLDVALSAAPLVLDEKILRWLSASG